MKKEWLKYFALLVIFLIALLVFQLSETIDSKALFSRLGFVITFVICCLVSVAAGSGIDVKHGFSQDITDCSAPGGGMPNAVITICAITTNTVSMSSLGIDNLFDRLVSIVGFMIIYHFIYIAVYLVRRGQFLQATTEPL